MRTLLRIALAVSMSVIFQGLVMGSWLSDITGIDINIPAGTVSVGVPHPQAIPQMLQHLPQDIGQAFLNPVGAVLATAIRNGAAQANWSARPLPPQVVQLLSPYFPPGVLNKAKWTLYDPNRITIDSAITAWFQGEGAVTLDNIIVFSDENVADSDIGLWAHELTHVMQYDNMGVESFAFVYSVNWNSLESQARDWSSRITAALQSQQGQQSPQAQQATYYSVAPGQPRYFTAQDYSQAARSFYPASSCARTQETQQALLVQNVCPIPIFVTGWDQQNPYNGVITSTRCNFNCVVAAGATMPFQGPYPGPMTQVYYQY